MGARVRHGQLRARFQPAACGNQRLLRPDPATVGRRRWRARAQRGRNGRTAVRDSGGDRGGSGNFLIAPLARQRDTRAAAYNDSKTLVSQQADQGKRRVRPIHSKAE